MITLVRKHRAGLRTCSLWDSPAQTRTVFIGGYKTRLKFPRLLFAIKTGWFCIPKIFLYLPDSDKGEIRDDSVLSPFVLLSNNIRTGVCLGFSDEQKIRMVFGLLKYTPDQMIDLFWMTSFSSYPIGRSIFDIENPADRLKYNLAAFDAILKGIPEEWRRRLLYSKVTAGTFWKHL